MEPLTFAIGLYLVALLLFAIDIFVPTGGILLFCSAACALLAVYFGFRASATAGLLMLLLVLATIPVLSYVFLKVWPHTPIGRRVLLDPPKRPQAIQSEELQTLTGTVVVTRWPLVPTGQIQIGHKRYNAMSSNGKIIEMGARVKVVEVHERMLVVCETTEPLTVQNASSITKHSDPSLETVDPLTISAEQIGLDKLDE